MANKKRVNISISPDTEERLKQYAFENHTTVSQAITDWVWGAKVKNENIRGQQSLDVAKPTRKKTVKTTKTTAKKGQKSMKEGRLGYNQENQRYGLLISDLWEHPGFHCGDTMEVQVNGEWIPTRIEMDNYSGLWYLVDTPYKGDLEYIRARI